MGSPQGFRVKVTKLSGFLREAVMRDLNFCKRQKTLIAVMASFAHPRAWSQKWFQDAIPTLSKSDLLVGFSLCAMSSEAAPHRPMWSQ